MDMKQAIEDLYEQWLIANCDDKLHSKEEFVDALSTGYRYEDFTAEVKLNF